VPKLKKYLDYNQAIMGRELGAINRGSGWGRETAPLPILIEIAIDVLIAIGFGSSYFRSNYIFSISISISIWIRDKKFLGRKVL